MHALTFHGIRDVRYQQVADPAIQAPTDVIIEIAQAGLCGSDLHPYRGHEQGLDVGCVMGHECIGTVVAAGSAVAQFGPGDRVLSPFTTSCGACFYCLHGLSARCQRGQLLGWVAAGEGLHGAQAEYVRVPLADSTLLKIPEWLSDDQALLLGDVLPTGFYCAEKALTSTMVQNHGRARPDGVGNGIYAVIGLGPVGLMAVWSARALGANQIYAIDFVPERLALSAQLGGIPINASDTAIDDIRAQLNEASDGRGADSVMELVGHPDAAALAYQLVRPGGTISIVGVHTAPQFPISPVQAYDKNLSIHIGRCPVRSLSDRLLALLSKQQRRNAPDPACIITHRVPLANGTEAYQRFERRADGCIKLIFTP